MKHLVKALCLGAAVCIAIGLPHADSLGATPSPTAIPTARPGTSSELKTFSAFVPATTKINMCAVAGNYAYVGYSGKHTGITALLELENKKWVLITKSGGALQPEEFADFLPGIPLAEAQNLYSLALSQNR